MPGRNDRLEKQQIQEKGDNEAEASLEYIKRKADKRAGKENGKNYIYRTATELINGEPAKVKQIKNKNDEVLAEIRYAERGNDFEIRMDNYGQEKGAARKALANLMEEYPNKEFYWEAINSESVKSYKHFVEEYPELTKRVTFIDDTPITKGLDSTSNNIYNSEKRVINEQGYNTRKNVQGTVEEIRGIDSSSDRANKGTDSRGIEGDRGIPESDTRGNIFEDIPSSGRGGQIADNNVRRTTDTLDTRPLADRQADVTSTQIFKATKNGTHITYRFLFICLFI